MEVVLAVEGGDELLGVVAVGGQVHGPASIERVESPSPTGTRPQKGAELELEIDTLAYGGAGVARLDGYVLFVQGAVPGDRVRAKVTKGKRAYAEARTLEVLEPGPDRVEPRAPHPGAPWQVLRYEAQLREKEAQVRDALER